MESIFEHLSEFVRFLSEESVLIILVGSLLFFIWYRKATSPLPTRRASFGRR